MDIKFSRFTSTLPRKLQALIEKKVAKLETYEDAQKVEVQLKVVKPAAALR